MLYPAELRARGGKRFILSYSRRFEPMARIPFVWQIQVRREALDDELAKLRQVPYALWRQVVAAPVRKTVVARDNKSYRLRVTAQYVTGDHIRVTATLARPTLLNRGLMRQAFVIAPDNSIEV